MKKKGIGLEVKKPTKTCTDKNCPFHSTVGVRGKVFTGLVVNDKMTRTVTIVWTRRTYVPKYERYEKKKSKLKAHNPNCIGAKKGDVVRIVETRPLSKTKHFTVIEVLGKESKKETLKEESLLESGLAEKKSESSKPSVGDVKISKKGKITSEKE